MQRPLKWCFLFAEPNGCEINSSQLGIYPMHFVAKCIRFLSIERFYRQCVWDRATICVSAFGAKNALSKWQIGRSLQCENQFEVFKYTLHIVHVVREAFSMWTHLWTAQCVHRTRFEHISFFTASLRNYNYRDQMIVMGNRERTACTNEFIVAAHHRQWHTVASVAASRSHHSTRFYHRMHACKD